VVASIHTRCLFGRPWRLGARPRRWRADRRFADCLWDVVAPGEIGRALENAAWRGRRGAWRRGGGRGATGPRDRTRTGGARLRDQRPEALISVLSAGSRFPSSTPNCVQHLEKLRDGPEKAVDRSKLVSGQARLRPARARGNLRLSAGPGCCGRTMPRSGIWPNAAHAGGPGSRPPWPPMVKR